MADALAKAADAVVNGVLDGIWRAVGLLLIAVVAYSAYSLSYKSFQQCELFDSTQRPKRLAGAHGLALFLATIAAVLITITGGYAQLPGCSRLQDCLRSVTRSDREVIASFTTAAMVVAGPVLAARFNYRPPSS